MKLNAKVFISQKGELAKREQHMAVTIQRDASSGVDRHFAMSPSLRLEPVAIESNDLILAIDLVEAQVLLGQALIVPTILSPSYRAF